MIPKQYAYAAGWFALAAMAVLFVVGLVRNPTQAARKEIERQLAEVAESEIDIAFAPDAKSGEWQHFRPPKHMGPVSPAAKSGSAAAVAAGQTPRC